MRHWYLAALLIFLLSAGLYAEPLRVMLAGTLNVSTDEPEGSTIQMSYIDSVAISLNGDRRFLRGIQLDLTAPQNYVLPRHRGSLAVALYTELGDIPSLGAGDIDARETSFDVLPDKILNTWHIPLRQNHGLRSNPYLIVPSGVYTLSSFPMLFRLVPVLKGITTELENMEFQLRARPVLSDEGILKINFIYPTHIPEKPVIVLINDVLIENPREERLFPQGEHQLLIMSEDYRHYARSFTVERAKTMEITVELHDPTPLLYFESPENARIFLDNVPVLNTEHPLPVEPGVRELRFQFSDYTVTRSFIVQRGRTYRIAVSVDLLINEN